MIHLHTPRAGQKLAFAAAIISTAVSAFAVTASAQRVGYSDADRTIVTAYSRYGNGEISASVRPAKFAPEVRLPGGTWVSCRRSCAETLRVETVDRDEGNSRDIGSGGLLNECGVFGCLEIRYPR